MPVQKITPFLWFNNQAEEAMKFYVSIFKNSKITGITKAPKGSPLPEGAVLTGTFVLDGVELMCLDGGPMFQFTEAISLMIHCADQAEVDHFWTKLVQGGGEHSQCGWLKDRFGLSWQVIPTRLGELMADKDKAKAGRVTQAMLQMQKIDIAKLEAAAKG
jgi:predicted 3-demethylubiquinone-9 3-methyltransferase (glyoxalase superfamily)